eukprot:UN11719
MYYKNHYANKLRYNKQIPECALLHWYQLIIYFTISSAYFFSAI